jgi:hypothetical protein
MTDVLFFSCKSIGLSKVNGRKPCDLRTAARHNLREIQAELGATGRIDPRQSVKNRILAGPDDAEGVASLAKNIAAGAGVDLSKQRRDFCQAIELVFSLPEKSHIEPLSFFDDCLIWAERAYKLPVLSAVIHLDESFPHCHVLMLPLENGRYLGGAPVAKPTTRDKTELFFNQVAGPAGLKRQSAKLMGQAKQVAIELVLAECESHGLRDAAGPLWGFIEDAIRRAPLLAMQALGIDNQAISDALSKPMGIERNDSNPIGISPCTQKRQSLSCVGIGTPASQTKASASKPSRLESGRKAQEAAIAKHLHQRQQKGIETAKNSRDDGLVVDREHSHNVDVWAD